MDVFISIFLKINNTIFSVNLQTFFAKIKYCIFNVNIYNIYCNFKTFFIKLMKLILSIKFKMYIYLNDEIK